MKAMSEILNGVAQMKFSRKKNSCKGADDGLYIHHSKTYFLWIIWTFHFAWHSKLYYQLLYLQ